MARSADSAADRELTARLAARGLTGSSTRYERWRHAGCCPVAASTGRPGPWLGLGAGPHLGLYFEIAAALARHARQGRDLRAAVVAWFFKGWVCPALPGQAAVPEPPDAAVAEALAWAIRASPGYRMLQRARSAVTEAQKDDFFRSWPSRAAGRAHLAASTRRQCAKRCLAAAMPALSPAGSLVTWCTWSRR